MPKALPTPPTPIYLRRHTVSASLIAVGHLFREVYEKSGHPPGVSYATRRRVEAGVAKLVTVERVAAAYGKVVVVTLEDGHGSR